MPNSERAGQQAPATEPADCTRWLDDEEQRAWRAFLRAAAEVDEALDRQLQRDAGHAARLLPGARDALRGTGPDPADEPAGRA